MPHKKSRCRKSQRGAAALAVSVVLLFGITLVAFFANRTLIFEQRSSANQMRATKAFEMADAGIEWAVARLNDPNKLVDATCTTSAAPTSAQLSFRGRYVKPTAANPPGKLTGWLDPVLNTYPGCSVDAAGAFTCACPTPVGIATAAVLTNIGDPKFRVQFKPVPGDDLSVEILSRGCSNGSACDPSAVPTDADSTAIVRLLLKVRPTFPTVPGAGLISGSTTVISGSLNVVNTDTASNGITINTGSTMTFSGAGTTVQTLPGTSPYASVLDNDPSLLQLTNADSDGTLFFSSYFGENFPNYKANPQTKVITRGGSSNYASGQCSNDGDCGSAVSYWVDRGITQFWLDVPSGTCGSPPTCGVTFNSSNMPSTTSGTLGTANNPIAFATNGQLLLNGGVTAYGILYAATATAQDDLTYSGGGSATIIGSLISRGDFARTGNGNVSIIYNANLFGAKGPPSGLLVPVPGSWRDKLTSY